MARPTYLPTYIVRRKKAARPLRRDLSGPQVRVFCDADVTMFYGLDITITRRSLIHTHTHTHTTYRLGAGHHIRRDTVKRDL